MKKLNMYAFSTQSILICYHNSERNNRRGVEIRYEYFLDSVLLLKYFE